MSSSSTLRTPSRVSASLSRVCEAASTKRVSRRLSMISACFSVQSPWITLTKSYTTRRSQPMIRSRLRRPTSKSITATFLRWRARPQARLALVVVLPTPPLPEVTTITSAVRPWASVSLVDPACGSATAVFSSMCMSGELLDAQPVLVQPDLHRLAAQVPGNLLHHLVLAGDGDQFGVELTAEDAGGAVALGAGQRAAAQGPVDVHRAVGDDLGAGAHGGGDDQVPPLGIDLLAGTHRLAMHQPGGRGGAGRDGGRRRLRYRRGGCRGRFRRGPGGARALVLGAKLGQHRQVQLARQLLDGI